MNTQWKERHISAMTAPHGVERPIVEMLNGWSRYAVAYRQRYESEIGTDSVLGHAWLNVAKGIHEMLNGEIGRLDAGTLDSVIRAELQVCGFDPDEDL